MSGHELSRKATFAIKVAVLVLPEDQRDRYTEEFHSELVALPTKSQFGYSLRLVYSSWALRKGLLASANEKSRKAQGSHHRLLRPLTSSTAILAIAFSGVSMAARDAQPGDALWGLTRILYSDHVQSTEAAVAVNTDLEAARAALRQGKVAETKDSLDKAGVQLPKVSVEDGHVDLSQKHTQLLDELVVAKPSH